jgi:hypothetical protein
VSDLLPSGRSLEPNRALAPGPATNSPASNTSATPAAPTLPIRNAPECSADIPQTSNRKVQKIAAAVSCSWR